MAKCVSCKKVKTCPFADDDSAYCDHFEQKPMTNADRIRAMTDKELAWLLSLRICRKKLCDVDCGKFLNCKMCFLDWLKQEVE